MALIDLCWVVFICGSQSFLLCVSAVQHVFGLV
jgi:hypothetical protein